MKHIAFSKIQNLGALFCVFAPLRALFCSAQKMITIFLLTLLFSGVTVMAQQNQTATQDTLKAQATPQVEQKDVRIFIDKIEVQGQLEKPQAVFILPGQTPDIDDIQIERSFMKEIFRPVEKRFTYETKYRPEYSKRRKDVIEW